MDILSIFHIIIKNRPFKAFKLHDHISKIYLNKKKLIKLN